jgi:hypothetical protein
MHQNPHSQALLAWDNANLALCRFIRGTLAMNVLPFVRRHVEAQALWDALVRLYGEENGIAMAGGPMMNQGGLVQDKGKARTSEHGCADERSVVAGEKGKWNGKRRNVDGGKGWDEGGAGA